jgi:hypothetical protein
MNLRSSEELNDSLLGLEQIKNQQISIRSNHPKIRNRILVLLYYNNWNDKSFLGKIITILEFPVKLLRLITIPICRDLKYNKYFVCF